MYADNDMSAYTGTPRPEWNRLIADVLAGIISGIACWHVDRLTRTPRELEDVIDLAERHSVELASARGRPARALMRRQCRSASRTPRPARQR